jgi:hypothetical protein
MCPPPRRSRRASSALAPSFLIAAAIAVSVGLASPGCGGDATGPPSDTGSGDTGDGGDDAGDLGPDASPDADAGDLADAAPDVAPDAAPDIGPDADATPDAGPDADAGPGFESACDDGLDDDGDGLRDCLDPDCCASAA